MTRLMTTQSLFLASLLSLLLLGCFGGGPEGIAPSRSAQTTVKMDFFHKPLPEIPLPNDVATRYSADSATLRRINASMVAATMFESEVRTMIDQLDGWGAFQNITIPFTGPLDINSIVNGHHKDNYFETKNDVIYLINIDPKSKDFGKLIHLDVGNGNYPVVLEDQNKYWKNDPRGKTISLLFDDTDEDTNGNGKLDPGEDTNSNGELDRPNFLPKFMDKSTQPASTDLGKRADALMSFYERATNTLIVRPMLPLDERTTYAVVITRRLLDQAGDPVGSPYPFIHHSAQTKALDPLPRVLPPGLRLEEVAFAFTFTTMSIQSHIKAVRDGLYGKGIQAHLGQNFPAKIASMEKLVDPKNAAFTNKKNLYILQGEFFEEVVKDKNLAEKLLGLKLNSERFKYAIESIKYIDYFVIGSFKSPQLFRRFDASGKMLPYNRQSWPQDLDTKRADAREEMVYFTMTIPRKEVSARKDGQPAPAVIIGHGYGGNRTEILLMGGTLARWGLAAVSIDCVSHGLGLSPEEKLLADLVVTGKGLKPFLDAVLKDRAWDQNRDKTKDSGADFWSAYVFHTRDMVRQSALDYMQLVRVMRSFDGTNLMTTYDDTSKTYKPLDLNADGKSELAGDFDGDGKVDVGGTAHIGMTGGSLGGIMSLTVGGMEPGVTTIVPVAGGAGLGDIGTRSRQGGVPEAFLLRTMGPLYVGTLNKDKTSSKLTDELKVETIVVDLADDRTYELDTIKGVKVGDTMVVENLTRKSTSCGVVSAEGTVRVSLEADAPRVSVQTNPKDCILINPDKECIVGDRLEIRLYEGSVVAGKDCKLAANAKKKATITKFGKDITFQEWTYKAGKPLIALIEGLGKTRASPGLRRFAAFASLVIEPGDPVMYMKSLSQQPMIYPGTKEKTGAHALIVTTMGDMNVPASSGVTAGRAAGIIDFLKPDPRYGKPINQVLTGSDTYVAEAVHTMKRFTNKKTGAAVHLDVENFAQGNDRFGADQPRMAQPLRIGMNTKDPLGGYSGAIFPLSEPEGTHGFDMPGEMTDKCLSGCSIKTGTDPCGCLKKFDIGRFMFNMMGRYFLSNGMILSSDLCNSRNDCADIKAVPPLRDKTKLD